MCQSPRHSVAMAFDMHSSLVLKSYPRNQTHIEMKMPEPGPLLAQARAGAAGTTFIQRLNDLAAEHKEMRSQTQHQQKVAALWSTMQQLSFDSKDLSAANPLAGSAWDCAGNAVAYHCSVVRWAVSLTRALLVCQVK